MNSAWQKNRRREVFSTLGRYFAILAIIALGVGFFSGLKVTKSAMLHTGDEYVLSSNLYDFRLVSTLGLTEEDVAYFSGLPDIEYAQGAVSVDFFANLEDGKELALGAHSITDHMNVLSLTDGRMPEKADECVADSLYFSKEDIGQTLTVSDANDPDTIEAFTYRQYTIVGLANSVTYLNRERGTTKLAGGTLFGFLYIPAAGFSTDYYTEAYLTLKEKYSLFSEAYDDAVESVRPEVESALQKRADIRFDQIVGDAKKELSDAQAEYDSSLADYESQKSDAQTEFADAEAQLEDAKQKIDESESALSENKNQAADAQSEYESGLAAYNNSLAAFNAAKGEASARFSAAQNEIDTNRAAAQSAMQQIEASGVLEQYSQLQNTITALKAQIAATDPSDPSYAVLTAQLEEAQAGLNQIEQSGVIQQYQSLQSSLGQLDTAQQELDTQKQQAEGQSTATWWQLAQAKDRLDTSKQQIEKAQAEISQGEKKLADAQAEYDRNLEDYNTQKADTDQKLDDAEQELADAQVEIDDAKKEIADIEPADCYTLDRTLNVGYSSFENDSSIVEGIAKVFPVFFFLVAALVCITTMTRMVEEQRTQIGTLKALGYSNAIIIWKYISYAGSAALIGCIIGFWGGSILFPWAIWKAYGMLYNFAPILYVFDGGLAAISLAASLLCSAGATYVACRAELLLMPAELMRPRAPKAGRRILLEKMPLFWNRLSFLRKVSIRNIMRYKKRLIMMILGIAGCTALLLTGLGLRDSISNIANDQFDNIWKYDYAITFTDEKTPEQIDAFISDTSGLLSKCVFVCSESMDAVCPDGVKSVNIIATDDSAITNLIDLHNQDASIPYPPEGSVVITAKLARLAGVGAGGQITLQTDDAGTYTFNVSGVCDNYVYNYIYMTAQTYENVFQKECVCKNAIARSAGEDVHGTAARLMDAYGAADVSVMQDIRDRVADMMTSLNSIVMLVISCAGALAFVVLFNLSNINITERAREIATIKVLGFYPREVRAYVFRENIILTTLGTLAGLPFGVLLHRFVMSQIQIDMVNFQVKILPASFALALAMTFAFTFAVEFMLRGKLSNINMVDSLKSVE